MIIRRNMICIKNPERIDLGEFLLWKPYKNILSNFIDLCTDKKAAEFDPVSRVYDGLEAVPAELKDYYESLLGVTSYFQASKGGRGSYIEKKFATIASTSSLNMKLSELLFYLENPELHKKRGIFTLSGLSSSERRLIRMSRGLWQGGNFDVTIDLGNIIKDEKALILMELKNRVDSGGTAARREIWTKKFRTILEAFVRNEKIFAETEGFFPKTRKEFTICELLNSFDIYRLELYAAILFNTDGSPATKDGDRSQGFYSSNVEGYQDILKFISSQRPSFDIVETDEENLKIEVGVKYAEDFKIVLEAVYGNQIPQKLFRKKYPVNDLLLLKFDDLWLAQLLSIDERTFLLKYGKNFMVTLKKLLHSDFRLRQLYNLFIESEGDLEYLKKIVSHSLKKYEREFEDTLLPKNVTKEQYLADVVQVLASAEA